MPPVTLAVVGAGNRGNAHGDWALANPGRARVVAVAEPRDLRRGRFAARHGIPAGATFTGWPELADRGRMADAVLICTQDATHAEPAIAFAELGYHVLLEKPMATTQADCLRIVETVEQADVVFAVCHVLRYTPYTALVKQVVDAGRLGDVVSVQHLEPVGFLHHTHSYVRGAWRSQDTSTFMLLAKSCHDLDWLQYVVGRSIRRVASFGGLTHFRPENRPAGAADRCLDCAVSQPARTRPCASTPAVLNVALVGRWTPSTTGTPRPTCSPHYAKARTGGACTRAMTMWSTARSSRWSSAAARPVRSS
jgi:predicted dehydrogenase